MITDGQGRGLYQAPSGAGPGSTRVRVAWTEPGTGAPRSQTVELKLDPGPLLPPRPERFQAWAFVPHLPDTPLHRRWLALDRASGRILVVERDGEARIWVGHGDDKAAPGDDKRARAGLADPTGLAVRPILPGQEALWEAAVVDQGTHRVLRLDPQGQLTPLAGEAGQPGLANGPCELARFRRPTGAAYGADGALYVSDTGNHRICRLAEGEVATLAGYSARPVWCDGKGEAAGFQAPGALAMDLAGRRLFVGDGPSLRLAGEDGEVWTLAGDQVPGFEAWRQDPPRVPALDRLCRVPCLGDPAALFLAGHSLHIVDRGNRALRTLCLDPGHPDLGLLATSATFAQEPPAEAKTTAGGRRPPTAQAASGPLFGPPETLKAPGPGVLQAKAGRVRDLVCQPLALAAMADGSMLLYAGDDLACGGCKTQRAKLTCRHLTVLKLVHLFRAKEDARTWRYQVVPFQGSWKPRKLRWLDNPEDHSCVVLGDADGVWKLRFSGGPGSLAVTGADLVYPFDRELFRKAGAPWGSGIAALRGGTLLTSDHQVALAPPGPLALTTTLQWLAGAPKAPGATEDEPRGSQAGAEETRGAAAGGPAGEPEDLLALQSANGSCYVMDSDRKLVYRVDPATPTRLRELCLTREGWPKGLAGTGCGVVNDTFLLLGRPEGKVDDPSQAWAFPIGPDGRFGPGRKLEPTVPRRGHSRLTADGDWMIVSALSITLHPNLAARAGKESRKRDAQARADAAAAAQLPALEARARTAADALLRRLEQEEAAARAKAEPAATAGTGDALPDPPADPEPAGEDTAAPEEETLDLTVLAPAALRPESKRTAAPRPERKREAATRAGAPAGRPRSGLRQVPVRGQRDRIDIGSALNKMAGFGFRQRFDRMMASHELQVDFNNHEYQGTNQCRDRLRKLLDSRGLAGAADPRAVHLNGQFFLSTKTVRKLANWMLRNTHRANRPEDLEGWEAQGRPSRPRFGFGMYVQQGVAGRDNRIVLELRDVRAFLEDYDRNDPSRIRWVKDELEAADGTTGLWFRPGKGLTFVRGVRLVVTENWSGFATIHPI
jgi:hypothetical protein